MRGCDSPRQARAAGTNLQRLVHTLGHPNAGSEVKFARENTVFLEQSTGPKGGGHEMALPGAEQLQNSGYVPWG